ncbi:hypothetical protein BFW01_g1330 [Lasiodiplodia theobromae]|uniref:Uncharacterized protein n=1 Tax=Lasiodiplodia theobromae TaxID=45133 RepID=A0A8H7IRR7_9PEZI|nr:hypothetical protein BFW01_g1330 [Lasiodiplodia theobromae]
MTRRHGRELQARKDGHQLSTPRSAQESRRSKANNVAPKPWPSTIYTQEDLKPYEKFRKLYGERKYAREFPKQKQTLSFTDDLPTEIRLMVYKHLGLQAPGGFFELWGPGTWPCQAEFRDNIFNPTLDAAMPIRNTFRKYAAFRKVVSLMRLCKKVHGEVAELFYGEQNFRFSNSNGFVMLGAWMHTIGALHFQCLRHVTVQIPMRDTDDRCISSLGGWKVFEQIVAKRGMRMPMYGLDKKQQQQQQQRVTYAQHRYDKTVTGVFQDLKSIPCLRKLELLVPWNFPLLGNLVCERGYLEQFDAVERVRHVVEDHCLDGSYWGQLAALKQDAVSSPDLEIALVVLHGLRCMDFEADAYFVQSHLRTARWLAAYAKIMGYGFGHARWKDGTYQVVYDPDPLHTASPRLLSEADDGKLEPPEIQAGMHVQHDAPRSSEEGCIEFQVALWRHWEMIGQTW